MPPLYPSPLCRDHLPDLTSALGGSGFEESSDKRSATSYVKVLLQTLEHMVEAGGDSQEVIGLPSADHVSFYLGCLLFSPTGCT